MDEYFKRQLRENYELLEQYNRQIIGAKKKISKIKSQEEIAELKDELLYTQLDRSIIKKELTFMRTPTFEDMRYRQEVYANFANMVREVVPDDFPLFFHGTKIYFANSIIKNGNISSTVDRYGFQLSADGAGEISVTTAKNVDFTIHLYIDILKYFMPAGCVFAIIPDAESFQSYKFTSKAKNVDFKSNPASLFAIITTLENIEMVKSWCQQFGINPNIVCSFFDFKEYFNLNKPFNLLRTK